MVTVADACVEMSLYKKYYKENAELIQDFDIDLFYSIIEKMTVFEGEKIIVTLVEGTEIECEIEYSLYILLMQR